MPLAFDLMISSPHKPTRALRASRWIATLFLIFAGLQPAHAEFIAEQINAANFETHHVGGPDAIAGIDDWFISNGTICAAISDVDHFSAIAPQGGVLVDLGHCGADNDQWTVLQPILNLTLAVVAPVTQVVAGTDERSAWIRTHALAFGVEIVTTYSLDADTPTALTVSTRASRIGKGDRLFSIGSLVFHPTGQTRPFSMLRADLGRSVGFTYPSASGTSITGLIKSLVSSDLNVLVGGDEMPPVSYGVERVFVKLDGKKRSRPLESFGVTGLHFTLLGTFTKPLWFAREGKPPGLLQLMQTPFMNLKPESQFSSKSRIWVGERADVASITDQIWIDSPVLRGSIDDTTARIHIDLRSGAPLTEIRPDSDGVFELRLPVGRYRARAIGTAGRKTHLDFEVLSDEGRGTLPPIELGPPGRVRMPDAFIGRLVFLNEDGSGPAVFGDHLLGFAIGDHSIPSGLESNFVNLAASPLDPKAVPLAPGRYRVVAIRGPEYEAAEIRIEVRAGEETTLELAPLARVAPTPGWISADLHVHSGISFDSSFPQPRQVVAFAASGSEVLVATEHDRIFDPRPAIRESGLSSRLVSITGMEITSAVGGQSSPYASAHLNAFPVTPRIGHFRNGAPSLERQRLRDTLSKIREIDSASFVQLNHPRSALSEAEDDTYFSHLGEVGEGFQPDRPIAEKPNAALLEIDPGHGLRDLDFQGMELMNAESLVRYRRARADWLSLMLQGERIVGTSNSDSHRQGKIVGLPRSYIHLDDDSLVAFDEARFMESLRAGRVIGSTGPFVRARFEEAGIGDLHSGSSGTLHVRVDAADWIPIAEWRAYVNGELVHRAPIAAGAEVSLPLTFDGDSFITIEVEGPAEGLYADALPDFTPFAFTNPIFVDADENGRFDAPGLPDTIPPAIDNPDQSD